MNNDFNKACEKTLEYEGGYTDGKNQIKDEATNMGIRQSILDKYTKDYPESNMPDNVRLLTEIQVREIYKTLYWDNTRIPQIKNERIRNAAFDMNVMSGIKNATITLQKAIKDIGFNIVVDGALGENTLKALNNIPIDKTDVFMVCLKEQRLDFLRKTRNWPTAKNGWLKRTSKY